MKLVKYVINELFKDITVLGGAIFIGLVLMVTLVTKKYSLFWQLFSGILSTTIVVVLIRTVYFKDRPQKIAYVNYIEKIIAASFPSLHSARAVFMALMFVDYFSDLLLKAILLVTAILVSYSRIYLKRHDWKDALGGIILGVGVYLIVRMLV